MRSGFKIFVAVVVNLSFFGHDLLAAVGPINFESPEFAPLELVNHGDHAGWAGGEGKVDITPLGEGYQGGQALRFPRNPGGEAWLRKTVDWDPAESVAFIDFRIKPAADPQGGAASFIANGTQLALQVPAGSSSGEIWAYSGGDGAAAPADSAQWVRAPGAFVIPKGGTAAADWLRLTLRHDYGRGVWDLFVDGRLAALNLRFDQRGERLETLEFFGSRVGDTLVDDLAVSPGNMLFADADKDGLPDDWERANGSNPNVYDRDDIKPGTGRSFADLYLNPVPAGRAKTAAAAAPLMLAAAGVPALEILGSHEPVGSLKGSLSVAADGASSYELPIELPKGTAGVEPKLSLNYSSNGGDAIAGLGWNLSGLQQIVRGPSSLKKDGLIDGVDFDDKDRFFLDGERLVCVQGGYGQPGSEYRTELDSFARITAVGSQGAGPTPGPASWKVETKGGLTFYLGQTTDSKIAATAGVISWSVNRVEDTLGNYYTAEYATDTGDPAFPGEIRNQRVARLRYTGYSGPSAPAAAPYASVEFDYELRPDRRVSLVAGIRQFFDKRLKAIRVLTGAYENHRYGLTYDASEQTGRSLLLAVQKTVAGVAIPPTTFEWKTVKHADPKWVEAPHLAVAEYGNNIDSTGDMAGYVTTATGDPTVIQVNGNVSRAIPLNYPVTAATKLEFEYKGQPIPNWAMIGLDENPASTAPSRLFRVVNNPGATPPLVSYTHAAYTYTAAAGTWQKLTIPVGATYTGAMQYLVLVNHDNDLTDGAGVSCFRNIKIYESGTDPATVPARQFDFGMVLPPMQDSTGTDLGIRLQDYSGDGYADIAWRTLRDRSNPATGDEIVLDLYGQNFIGGAGGFKTTSIPAAGLNLMTGVRQGIPDTAWAKRTSVMSDAVDVNGDGVTEFGYARDIREVTAVVHGNEHGFLSWTPSGWIDQPAWKLPFKSQDNVSYQRFAHFEYVDLDGDGLQDVTVNTAHGSLISDGGGPTYGANTGAVWLNRILQGGGWVDTPAYALPLPLRIVGGSNGGEGGRRLLDVNADGLPDFMECRSLIDRKLWLNTGSGWALQPGGGPLELPVDLNNTPGDDIGTRTLDLNGDGLTDVIKDFSYGGVSYPTLAYLGTGAGWQKVCDAAGEPWFLDVNFSTFDKYSEDHPATSSLVDLNGDGLVDLAIARYDRSTVYFNTGYGWWEADSGTFWADPTKTPAAANFAFPAAIYTTATAAYNGKATGLFTDVNGDGVADFISGMGDPQPHIWINQCGPEVVKAVTDGFGVRTEVEYSRLNDPALLSHSTAPVYQSYDPAAFVDPLPAGQVVVPSATLVVSRLRQPDGRGGWRGIRRHYGDMRFDRNNETSLGFGWTEIHEEHFLADNSYVSRGYTRIENDPERAGDALHRKDHRTYPITGSPAQTRSYVHVDAALLAGMTHLPGVTAGTKLVSEDLSSYGMLPSTIGTAGGIVKRPVQTQTISRKFDLNGVKVSEATTTQPLSAFDSYGFLLSSTITALDGVTVVTTNSYSHNVTTGATPKWYLGRLTASTVVKKATPTGPAVTTRTTAFTYNAANGLLTSETVEPGNPLAVQTTYSRDAFGNVARTEITASGQTRWTESSYGSDGRFLRTETTPLGASQHLYDASRSLMLSTVDHNGLSTTFEYDGFGTKLVTHSPDGTDSAEITRNVTNASVPSQVAGELTAAGMTLRWARTAQSSGAPPTSVYFDILGRELVKEASVMTSYSGSGSPVFQPQYSITLYDARGRKSKVSQPFLAGETIYWTSVAYDPVDRPYITLHPDGTVDGLVSIQAVQNGNAPYIQSTLRDRKFSPAAPTQHVITRREDQRQRLIWSTDSSGQITEFSYDLDDHLTEARINSIAQLRNRFDLFGNKTGSWDISSGELAPAAGGSWDIAGCATTAFNGFREAVSVRNPLGQYTTSSYDLLGRISQVAKPEGTFVYSYRTTSPALGEISTVSGPGYSESTDYDALGRVIATSKTQFGETTTASITYNALGEVETETDAGGAQVVHDYAPVYGSQKIRSRLVATNTTLWQFVAVQTIAGGRMRGTELLTHGVTRQTDRDAVTGRILNITSTGLGKTLQNLSYTWDANGNLTSRSDALNGRTETFAYDTDGMTLDRLNSSTIAGQAPVSYAYDAKGNLTSKGGEARGYTDASRPYAVKTATVKGVARTYGYDSAGRVTADGKRTYQWSSFHQLAWVSQLSAPAMETFPQTGVLAPQIPGIAPQMIYQPSQATATFSFSSAGTRARQTLMRTFGDTSQAMAVTDYLGAYEREIHSTKPVSGVFTATKTVHRHQLAGSLYTQEVTAGGTVERLALVLTDQLGGTDVIVRADRNGSTWKLATGDPRTERQSFDSWGERRNADSWANFRLSDAANRPTSAMDYDRGYTGHEMLDDFGLIHMNGRIYDAELGRFLSPDPYVQVPEYSQNFNRYSYVLNNPLSRTDSSGHKIDGIWAVVIGIVVSAITWGAASAFFGALGGIFTTTVGGVTSLSVTGQIAVGLVAGAVSGGVNAALTGQDVGKGIVNGAITGASGGAMAGMGSGLLRMGLQATAAGLANEAIGGKFADGFISSLKFQGIAGLGKAMSTFAYSHVTGTSYDEFAGISRGTEAMPLNKAGYQIQANAEKYGLNASRAKLLEGVELPEGWNFERYYGSQNTNLNYAVFVNSYKNIKLMSMVGTQNTGGFWKGDWGDDLRQSMGFKVPQYMEAIKHAEVEMAKASSSGQAFVLTGHSLGGGLAAAASAVTGAPALIFNAAGVNPATFRYYGKPLATAPGANVVHYMVNGEILNVLQIGTGGLTPQATANTNYGFMPRGPWDIKNVLLMPIQAHRPPMSMAGFAQQY